MKIIIDILLLVIIALCTWNGYKRGLVGGVAGILAIIIALFGGSLLSSAYAHEVVPALEPFVDGYIDSQKTRDAVLERLGYGNSDLSLEDIPHLLEIGDRRLTGPTMPPQGLYLNRVWYDGAVGEMFSRY